MRYFVRDVARRAGGTAATFRAFVFMVNRTQTRAIASQSAQRQLGPWPQFMH